MQAVPDRPRASLLKNPTLVATQTARLKNLCRQIVRDRSPYCPLNGILLLVPYGGAEKDADAQDTGLICPQELQAARQALQVQCPLIALVCDMETAPGFSEFVARFPTGERQRRIGQRFPLNPDLNAGESAAELIDRGAQWPCAALFPSWIYKLFRLEGTGKEDLTTVTRGNVKLYQLLAHMRERRKRFGRILSRAVPADGTALPLYGGCYYAGTGRDANREQAFVAGVVQRLLKEQNAVSWTPEAIAEEAEYERWTKLGYAGLVAGTVALVALIYFTFFSKGSS
jgi:hypothetical protein